MDKKILVVDDEKAIVKGIKYALEQDGYIIDAAYDGEEAMIKVKEEVYDCILLDVMMPKMDGLQTCQQIREFSMVPIIMLTAKGEDMDKILGLDYGADDYITKPFNILEVKARIKALLRRVNAKDEVVENSAVLQYGSIRLLIEERRAFIDDEEKQLTAKEFDILELLTRNPEAVYSREKLLNCIWGEDYSGDARTVDVHMRRLREKIEPNPAEPRIIHTKWGIGYYVKVE